MSIAEFSDAFKNRVFSDFSKLNRTDKKNAINIQDTNKLRTLYESASSGASSVLTNTGLLKLFSSITSSIEDIRLAEYADKVLSSINYNNFVSYVQAQVSASKSGETISLGNNDFRIQNVPQESLRRYFLDYLSIILELDNGPLTHKLLDYVTHHIQSGHLAGVFSLKLIKNLGLTTEVTGATYRDFRVTSSDASIKTDETLEVILKALLDADFLTSNITDKEEIFTTAAKSVLGGNPHLEVELQFKKDNEAAGKLLNLAGGNLNKLLKQLTINGLNNTDADNAFKKLVASLQPLVSVINTQAKILLESKPSSSAFIEDILSNSAKLDKLSTELINIKGSPSILESISISLTDALLGKKSSKIVTKYATKTKISTKDKGSADINKALKSIKEYVSKTKKTSKSAIKLKSLNTITNHTYSLASLQVLLNANLQHVVAANMGDGAEKRILNYRTGRFAGSVSVTNLTQSRQGMITAFYTYMKNPYQTFEPGFRQGSPRTRDPKLLIATSIAEIAATKVVNRMRAVLV